jgi:hypothetical protein
MFIGPLLLLVVAPALRRIFLAGDHTAVRHEAGEAQEDGAVSGGVGDQPGT